MINIKKKKRKISSGVTRGNYSRGKLLQNRGNKRLKERGKAEREEGNEWGNRGSIGPAQRWYQSMQQ